MNNRKCRRLSKQGPSYLSVKNGLDDILGLNCYQMKRYEELNRSFGGCDNKWGCYHKLLNHNIISTYRHDYYSCLYERVRNLKWTFFELEENIFTFFRPLDFVYFITITFSGPFSVIFFTVISISSEFFEYKFFIMNFIGSTFHYWQTFTFSEFSLLV